MTKRNNKTAPVARKTIARKTAPKLSTGSIAAIKANRTRTAVWLKSTKDKAARAQLSAKLAAYDKRLAAIA
jgi:hypothetical protein